MRIFLLTILMLVSFACFGDGKPMADSIPWKTPAYSLVARSMPLREALETFGTAQGISVVMSKAVAGTFSGSFKDVPAGEFLDRIATAYNLIWYYDGAALYVYASGEVQTFLLDLKYMKAGEVRALIKELGVEDTRFPIKTASNDELIMVSGPPRYVALVSEIIAKADKLRELRTFNEVEARVFPLVNTWADDVSFSVSNPESSVTIRGVARMLEDIMSSSSEAKVREASTNGTNEASVNDGAITPFQPIIRPDNRLNAVIVRDVVTRFPMYEKLIKELDVPQKLVEIGVTVVEMSREDALDWQLSLKSESETSGGVRGTFGQNAKNLFDGASVAGKGLAGAQGALADAQSTALSTNASADRLIAALTKALNDVNTKLKAAQTAIESQSKQTRYAWSEAPAGD